MKYINKTCVNCGVTYKKSVFANNRSVKNGVKNTFCSKKCSSEYGGMLSKEIYKLNLINYNNSPVLCLNCNSNIEYKKRHNTYCSRSCSATHLQKDEGHCKWSEVGKSLLSKKIKSHWELARSRTKKYKSPVVPRLCKNCNIHPLDTRKQICHICHINYYKFYRPLCEFTFNPIDYPNNFDICLIKKFGKYSPSNKGNNLNGVSRDHLYSVKDGFNNKVSPEIIKHPANCKLMLHTNNQQKYNRSSISLDELKRRIRDWTTLSKN